MSAKTSLLDAIMNADGKELELIDDKLKQLDERVEVLQAEAAKLRALRKTVSILINGKPPRKKREAKPKAAKPTTPPAAATTDKPPAETVDDRRQKIAKLLGEVGAAQAPDIADELEIPKNHINYLLNCESFQKTSQGWNLTTHGRSKYF